MLTKIIPPIYISSRDTVIVKDGDRIEYYAYLPDSINIESITKKAAELLGDYNEVVFSSDYGVILGVPKVVPEGDDFNFEKLIIAYKMIGDKFIGPFKYNYNPLITIKPKIALPPVSLLYKNPDIKIILGYQPNAKNKLVIDVDYDEDYFGKSIYHSEYEEGAIRWKSTLRS